MRNRGGELVAIMEIQIDMFCPRQVPSPRFGVKHAKGLLEIEHSFPYHSHRRNVNRAGLQSVQISAAEGTEVPLPDGDLRAHQGRSTAAARMRCITCLLKKRGDTTATCVRRSLRPSLERTQNESVARG